MEVNVCIKNLRNHVYKWFKFPVSEEVIREQLGMSEDDEYIVVDDELHPIEVSEYTNIQTINEFSEMVAGEDKKFIFAVADFEEWDVDDFVQNFEEDNYLFYPDILDEYDLGEYYIENDCYDIPESLIMYFDYENYGRDLSINNGGMFTKWGWIEYE